MQRDGRHPGAGPRRRTQDPARRVAGQKDSRQGQDEHEPGDDEAQPAYDPPHRPPQAPGAVDGQLGRGRAGEQVRGGDGVFELLSVDPASFLDAHAPQQADVGRGAPEPDATETGPLLGDGADGDPRHRGLPHFAFLAAHGASPPSTSWASSLSWRLADSRARRPLAVAT